MAVMGPFIDSGISPAIVKEYDIDLKKATKLRSIIKVESQLGTFTIKKAKISYTQAERMKEILHYLKKHDLNVQQLLPNKYGDYFIPVTDGVVYATKWIEGKSLKINHGPHLRSLISMMAYMHRIGFSFVPNKNFTYRYVDELYIRNTWQDRLNWFKHYNQKLKRNKNTAFEHLIQSYSTFLIDWGEEAIEHLNQWIIKYSSISKLRKTIIHGKFHHRNSILTEDQKLYLLDFDHASIDTPVRDIANFIRHYILNKEHQMWAKDWIKLYQKQVELSTAEKKLLGIYLLFPERILSLTNRYEQKHYNWSEEFYLKKLQIRLDQMKELVWFVDAQQWVSD